jgi:hypothetical protein
MEKWYVQELHVEHLHVTGAADSRRIECGEISWSPGASLPSEKTSAGRGYLLAQGCDIAGLKALPWTPTRLRFKVLHALEDRLFEVEGYDISDDGNVYFWLPSTLSGDQITGGSDGHIQSFKGTDQD